MRAAFARTTHHFLFPCVQEQIAWATPSQANRFA